MRIDKIFLAIQVSLLILLTPGVGQAQLLISFDYSFDSNNFFTDPIRKTVLEKAADAYRSRLTDALSAITPGGANTWSPNFTHPGTGLSQSVSDPTIAANTLVIYVGGRNLGGPLGLGGPGGFSAGGSGSFLNTVSTRGQSGAPATDFGPWGGSISFNNTSSWHFDTDPSTPDVFPGENDFYSVAVHELGHVLGIGTATSWNNKINGGNQFTGPASVALFGGNVPLSGDSGHWNNGITSTLPGTATSQEVAMDPDLTTGTRKFFTDLDYAGLTDIGWQVSPVPEPMEYAMVTGLGLLVFGLHRRRTSIQA